MQFDSIFDPVLQPTKCYTFSSCPAANKYLENHPWRRLNKTVIPNVTDCRDLGAYLNAGRNKMVATTLTERLAKSTESTKGWE